MGETRGPVGATVTLALLRGGLIYVSANVPNTGALNYTIPSSVPKGSNYQVGVQIIVNPSVRGLSNE